MNRKAILIDDERLARVELRRLLANHPQIEIIAEAASVAEALKLIHQHQPHLQPVVLAPHQTGDSLERSDEFAAGEPPRRPGARIRVRTRRGRV